jgi:hypothetical protein
MRSHGDDTLTINGLYASVAPDSHVGVRSSEGVVVGESALRAGSPRWDLPVTSLLIAYADEPPGSAGCG